MFYTKKLSFIGRVTLTAAQIIILKAMQPNLRLFIYKYYICNAYTLEHMTRCILFLFLLFPTFIQAQVISTIAGGGTGVGNGGPATASNLGVFGEIAIDNQGNIIIAANNDARVRKVDAITGIITTIGGTGTSGYTGDNGPATVAQFNWPNFVACDHLNNVYVSDHSHRIRKIDAITGIVSTIAGNGIAAFLGDGGPATAASINEPEGIVFDAIGNLYFADNTNSRIRKISTTGIITTIAGTGMGGYSGDGGAATAAEINPWGISIDSYGKLYFSDDGSYIRKIDLSTGIINTVVGYGSAIYNGDNIPATSAGIGPVKMTFDVNNNMYIGDSYNNRIRMVDNSGIIHTVAGKGSNSFSGDGGLATNAEMYGPGGVEYFCGNIYIADAINMRVRKITYNSTSICPKLSVNNVDVEKAITIYPNPTSSECTISYDGTMYANAQISIYDITGRLRHTYHLTGSNTIISTADLAPGMYQCRIDVDGISVVTKKLVVMR